MSFYQEIAADFGSRDGLDGGDASLTYAKNNKLILYIAQKNSQRFVSFKGFIDNFKLSIKYTFDQQEAFHLKGKKKFLTKTNVEYHFTLNVPSSNVTEALNNMGKFEEVSRYLLKVLPSGVGPEGKVIDPKNNIIYFSLANLIQSGLFTSRTSVLNLESKATFDNIQKYGAPGYLTKINLKTLPDLGFYKSEHGGLVPKAFSIDLQLLVSPDTEDSGVLLLQPFTTAGNFAKGDNKDSKYWPFGVIFEDPADDEIQPVSPNAEDNNSILDPPEAPSP